MAVFFLSYRSFKRNRILCNLHYFTNFICRHSELLCYFIRGRFTSEILKELTRGRRVTAEILHDFVKALPLPKADRDRLLKLTPANYVGLAAKLAKLA